MFDEGDGFFPLGSVRRIWTVLAIDCNVHHRAACVCHACSQFFQVRRFQLTKMCAPGLDFLDVEFGADVRGELFQLHFSAAGFVFVPRDKIPERIRGNRYPLPRCHWELNVRHALSRER